SLICRPAGWNQNPAIRSSPRCSKITFRTAKKLGFRVCVSRRCIRSFVMSGNSLREFITAVKCTVLPTMTEEDTVNESRHTQKTMAERKAFALFTKTHMQTTVALETFVDAKELLRLCRAGRLYDIEKWITVGRNKTLL